MRAMATKADGGQSRSYDIMVQMKTQRSSSSSRDESGRNFSGQREMPAGRQSGLSGVDRGKSLASSATRGKK